MLEATSQQLCLDPVVIINGSYPGYDIHILGSPHLMSSDRRYQQACCTTAHKYQRIADVPQGLHGKFQHRQIWIIRMQ